MKKPKRSEEKEENDGYMPNKDYIRVPYFQPHWTRRKEMMKSHPEIKQLAGTDAMTAVYVVTLVSLSTLLAYMCSNSSIITIFIMAYGVGAFIMHAQWVLIHELTHDLAFKSPRLNTLFLLLCNLDHLIPSAVAFRYYHKMHHGHLNETYSDPDVPSPLEDRLFGRSAVGKAFWLSFFFVLQSLRLLRSSPQPFEWAGVFNVLFNLLYGFSVYRWLGGAGALSFLILSSLLSVGFLVHPLGARWVAEHFSMHPVQETYSYYGTLNTVAFNIGYHNEHHDFTGIPWSKLPLLRRIAPEYYETLHQHKSYLRVLWEFIFNPNVTLRSRVVRWPKSSSSPSE